MREYFNPALNRWVVYVDGRQQYRYRWLMEQHLGRELEPDEHVHHVNGDQTDDRLENLQVLSASEHTKLHVPERLRRLRLERGDRWAPTVDECVECGTSERPFVALEMCGRCYYRLNQRRRDGRQPRKPATVITKDCLHCGEEFSRTLHQGGHHKYCSRSCAGKGSAPERWAKRRAA